MLVVGTLVPAAGILLAVHRQRAHLYRIVHRNHEHRRRHVVPRAQQTHYLRLRRVIHKILYMQRRAREHPRLVNAGREQVRGQRAFRIVEILVLRPLVLPAIELHPRPRRIPLRRTHQRIVKTDMPPVLVFALGRERSRLVHDVVVHRDVEGAVAVTRVGAPRVINVKYPRRVKAFALAPDFKRRLGCVRRPVDKHRVGGRKCRSKFHDGGTVCRECIPRGLVADKVSTLYRVRRHHRGRNRAVEPPALRGIARNEPHQHGIRTENHLRQGLVPPRALEPHNFRTRSHERLLVGTVSLRV